jgi:hypothetical protein
MNNMQIVDIFSPIISNRKGHRPLYINVGIQPADGMTESGPMTLPIKNEIYVCLSQLPDEIRRRVETAIQTLLSSP